METTSRGHRIYYEVAGAGEPLILIPGLGNGIQNWEDPGYLAALADRFKLISLDPLGHGSSAKPLAPDAYERRGVAADVIAVMDAEGHDSAHVFGYSRGANIAGNVATLFPERVRSLICGGWRIVPTGQALSPERAEERIAGVLAALRNHDWDGYWDAMGFRPGPANEAEYAARNEPLVLAAVIEAGARPPSIEIDVAPVRGRMLVFAGTADLGLQAPGAIERFSSGCEGIGARLELLEGLTHSQAIRRSDLVIPLVTNFLATVARDDPGAPFEASAEEPEHAECDASSATSSTRR
jgi:pimeloyl-ACP methyl ester carboxylesterase